MEKDRKVKNLKVVLLSGVLSVFLLAQPHEKTLPGNTRELEPAKTKIILTTTQKELIEKQLLEINKTLFTLQQKCKINRPPKTAGDWVVLYFEQWNKLWKDHATFTKESSTIEINQQQLRDFLSGFTALSSVMSDLQYPVRFTEELPIVKERIREILYSLEFDDDMLRDSLHTTPLKYALAELRSQRMPNCTPTAAEKTDTDAPTIDFARTRFLDPKTDKLVAHLTVHAGENFKLFVPFKDDSSGIDKKTPPEAYWGQTFNNKIKGAWDETRGGYVFNFSSHKNFPGAMTSFITVSNFRDNAGNTNYGTAIPADTVFLNLLPVDPDSDPPAIDWDKVIYKKGDKKLEFPLTVNAGDEIELIIPASDPKAGINVKNPMTVNTNGVLNSSVTANWDEKAKAYQGKLTIPNTTPEGITHLSSYYGAFDNVGNHAFDTDTFKKIPIKILKASNGVKSTSSSSSTLPDVPNLDPKKIKWKEKMTEVRPGLVTLNSAFHTLSIKPSSTVSETPGSVSLRYRPKNSLVNFGNTVTSTWNAQTQEYEFQLNRDNFTAGNYEILELLYIKNNEQEIVSLEKQNLAFRVSPK